MSSKTNTVTFKNGSSVTTIPVKLIKNVDLIRNEKHPSGTVDFRTVFKLKFSEDRSLFKRLHMKVPHESDSSEFHELDPGEQKIYEDNLRVTLEILSKLCESNFIDEDEYNVYLNSIENCIVEYSRWRTEDISFTLDKETEEIERDRQEIQKNSKEVLENIDKLLELEEEMNQMKNEKFL